MTRGPLISLLRRRLRHALLDTAGTTLVEFAIVLSLFLLLFLGLIDFGRMSFNWVMAQKATQMAARIATVRPPVCGGLPEFHSRGTVPTGTTAPGYGTFCRTASWVCADPGTFSCPGASTNATAQEIWDRVAPLLPNTATVANLQFTYDFDSQLGFLGGPYTPMVTVELQNMQFDFVSPLGGLAQLAGAGSSSLGSPISMPSFSASLPGEDLAAGNDG
ncbi:hypothetical protein Ga0609869_003102 [Rhodovulum iodosum]|uniref:TadE-like domain-containing protein n=1 Tax=Rhodovulum iodosum TaxID=68291 RepID=A0ABV3XWQ5_9RHOB|nr:TadE/TadG family type IV pilus assembly protein [Rhodovulum robiginosum]RSK34202.1 pilus assembly protein [Rhodovulum robiginosum]